MSSQEYDPDSDRDDGRTFFDPESGKKPSAVPFHHEPLKLTPDGRVQLDSQQEAELHRRTQELHKRILTDVNRLPQGLEKLQREGAYPCMKAEIADMPVAAAAEKALVSRLAAICLDRPEKEITSVEHISEVTDSGREIFVAGVFQRPRDWASSYEPESLERGYKLSFLKDFSGVYQIRLADGSEYWFRRDHLPPLVPLGHQLFTQSSENDFDPQRYQPDAQRLTPSTSDRSIAELVGKNTDAALLYDRLVSFVQQTFAVDPQDFTLWVLKAGVPGASGPIVRVQFDRLKERLPIYLSAQQLASQDLDIQTIKRLQAVERDPIPGQRVVHAVGKGFRGLAGQNHAPKELTALPIAEAEVSASDIHRGREVHDDHQLPLREIRVEDLEGDSDFSGLRDQLLGALATKHKMSLVRAREIFLVEPLLDVLVQQPRAHLFTLHHFHTNALRSYNHLSPIPLDDDLIVRNESGIVGEIDSFSQIVHVTDKRDGSSSWYEYDKDNALKQIGWVGLAQGDDKSLSVPMTPVVPDSRRVSELLGEGIDVKHLRQIFSKYLRISPESLQLIMPSVEGVTNVFGVVQGTQTRWFYYSSSNHLPFESSLPSD